METCRDTGKDVHSSLTHSSKERQDTSGRGEGRPWDRCAAAACRSRSAPWEQELAGDPQSTCAGC